MKKILFLINTLNTGGAERVLVDLVSKLPKQEYRVTVQTLVGGRYEAELPDHVQLKKIIRTTNATVAHLLTKLLSKMPTLTGRWFVKNNYDIEVAYLEGFPAKVIASRQNSRAKKIAFIHIDVAIMDLISPQYPNKAACLAQYRVFDKVCFVSQQAKDGFSQVFGALAQPDVIHNVIDFGRIRRQALETVSGSYSTHGMKLIAVGRLARQKGFDRLIRICAELEKEFDFELLILGGGELHEELQAVIAETGTQSVRLMGMQSNPYAWMRQADLMVCSSFAEGYSTTILEALSLGLPVLTTACAGMEEILEGGSWGKITGLSDEALRDGLREVLQDSAHYQDLKQRARIRAGQLTDEASIREYLALFDSL